MYAINFLFFIMLSCTANAANKQEEKSWTFDNVNYRIPLYVDERTGFVDHNVKTIINLSNSIYTIEDRKQIIEYCRQYSIDKLANGNLIKNYTEGLLVNLKEEFQHCAVEMIKQWEEDNEKEPGVLSRVKNSVK